MAILWSLVEHQSHIENNGMSIKTISSYNVMQLFEKLQNDYNVDEMDVARLEMAFMPYFRYDGKPKCLTRCITKMPEIFIDFVSKVYKPDDGKDTTPEVSEQIISSAYEVLEKFNEIPGCNSYLTDEEAFADWVQSAMRAASELGYTQAFEVCIGKLLSYAPVGNDGAFPHEIVRNFIESNYSEPLARNFIIEKQNQRGVHTATWGTVEMKIAYRYKKDASLIRLKFPKTASILDKLSEHYVDDSRREQTRDYGDFS